MTTAEKLARLNQLRQDNGKAPLKAWKSSGEKLDQAIQAELEAWQGEKPEAHDEPEQQTGDQPETQTDETEEPSEQTEEPEAQSEATEEPKSERGAIGRLVIDLLTKTDDDYATIVGKVKEEFPSAKTTARSIASIAADLRRDGVDVKSRRKVKAPKAD